MRNRLLALPFILAAGVAFAAETPKRFEFTSVHMGTQWRIVLYAPDEATAEMAQKAAFERVAELDRAMSDYTLKSELMKFCLANDDAPGKPVAISGDLFRVLKHSKEIAELSDGAFDPTIGPLVKLWRAAKKTKKLASDEDLKAAKELVGYKLLSLDEKAKAATLAKKGMRLDLGGIGKGYAADEALAVLRAEGIASALVAASGDITASNAPPEKDGWLVEIAPLREKDPKRMLKLVNQSVSTSGDLFQFVEIEGVRYSHVLDPKTGLGLTGRRSATVIAAKGWQADALTKAASVLPPKDAVKLIDSIPGAATSIVVRETETGEEVKTESKEFGKSGATK